MAKKERGILLGIDYFTKEVTYRQPSGLIMHRPWPNMTEKECMLNKLQLNEEVIFNISDTSGITQIESISKPGQPPN